MMRNAVGLLSVEPRLTKTRDFQEVVNILFTISQVSA